MNTLIYVSIVPVLEHWWSATTLHLDPHGEQPGQSPCALGPSPGRVACAPCVPGRTVPRDLGSRMQQSGKALPRASRAQRDAAAPAALGAERSGDHAAPPHRTGGPGSPRLHTGTGPHRSHRSAAKHTWNKQKTSGRLAIEHKEILRGSKDPMQMFNFTEQ